MHASKLLLVISLTAGMAVATTLRAEDTPEEAALRAALRQFTDQGDAQQVSMQPAAEPAPVSHYETSPQSAQTQPVATSEPSDACCAFGSVPAPTGDSDALIHALRTQPGETSTPTVTEPTEQVSAPPQTVSPEPEPVPEAKKASPAPKSGFAPIESPPLSISASKEDRLAALLVDYKADRITPEEYHKQRAAILAEP